MEWTKDEVIKKMEELRDKGFISVPEGMFRKDKEAIDTWSMQKINECAYIQRNLIIFFNI